MIQKFAVLSGLVLSATCMVYHQPSLPLHHNLQYNANPSYNFAYDVNDPYTGDIKSQHESRRGDLVNGQYSLVQPDGIRSTVDYRADEHSGFQATVNNDRRATYAALGATGHSASAAAEYQQWPALAYSAAPTSGAVSSTSFTQSFSHSPIANNPWP